MGDGGGGGGASGNRLSFDYLAIGFHAFPCAVACGVLGEGCVVEIDELEAMLPALEAVVVHSRIGVLIEVVIVGKEVWKEEYVVVGFEELAA